MRMHITGNAIVITTVKNGWIVDFTSPHEGAMGSQFVCTTPEQLTSLIQETAKLDYVHLENPVINGTIQKSETQGQHKSK